MDDGQKSARFAIDYERMARHHRLVVAGVVSFWAMVFLAIKTFHHSPVVSLLALNAVLIVLSFLSWASAAPPGKRDRDVREAVVLGTSAVPLRFLAGTRGAEQVKIGLRGSVSPATRSADHALAAVHLRPRSARPGRRRQRAGCVIAYTLITQIWEAR